MSSNTYDHDIVVTDDEREPGDAAGEPGAQVNPLMQVHALLRGRYWIAVILAIIGAVIGAPLGYRWQNPTYTSTGMIRVKPYVPRVLNDNDQNGAMPYFDQFVASQVALIRSRRVIDHAMQQPDWKALNFGVAPEQVQGFTDCVDARNPVGTLFVLVTFTHEDPEVARRGVKSTIDAYEQLYGETASETTRALLRQVQEKQNDWLAKQKATNAKKNAIAVPGPTGSMDQVYETRLLQTFKLKARLDEIDLLLNVAGDGELPAPKPAQTPLTVDELALSNPRMERLTDERDAMKWQLARDRNRLGDKHKTVLEGEQELARRNAEIDELAVKLNQMRQQGGDAAVGSAPRTREQLLAERTTLQERYKRENAETEELGRKLRELEQLHAEAEEQKEVLTATKKRIDELTTEAGMSGRIEVESRGDVPLAPTKDKRKTFAAAAAVGFAGAGVGLVLLFGFFDRRIRHISDVKTTGQCNRVLGVLPMLPTEESDPEQAMIAAHGVHQIRMLLQAHVQSKRNNVIAITSASPGAGKTSLTLALGLSFAASGARTLMIDCDLIGGGLTSKIKRVTRRRTGCVLRRLGLITTEQLVAAVRESRRRGERVGETLIRQGIVTRADVDHALQVQQDSPVGLREALMGDAVTECITGGGAPGLFVMPLGSAQPQHVAQMSLQALQRLISQVRGWFDVVLIDTGPILGSLEASVAAMVADDVVLAVAKGEQRSSVDRAIQHLNSVGGRLAGIVLNRAAPDDIRASEFSSSSSRTSGDPEQRVAARVDTVKHECLQLGPIGRAVAASGDTYTPPLPAPPQRSISR